MTDYVAGFLYDEYKEYVLLVKKNRPEWQAGKLNGIGGHIEVGETPLEAMEREFLEETGLKGFDWKHFATVSGDWGNVYFYRAFTVLTVLAQAKTLTDEEILIKPAGGQAMLVYALPNLSWLLALGKYVHDDYEPVVAKEIS